MSLSAVRFNCKPGCNHCCTWMDYPSKPNTIRLNGETGKEEKTYDYFLGKQGVELQAHEVWRIRRLAKKLSNRVDDDGRKIEYRILPHTGISGIGAKGPDTIKTHQLMGRTVDGDICPFLSTDKENKRSPTEALACLIYEDRPLVCRGFPVKAVYQTKGGKRAFDLSTACPFIVDRILKGDAWLLNHTTLNNICSVDLDSIVKIQTNKAVDQTTTTLWRYATGIYNQKDSDKNKGYVGWVDWGWF